MKGQKPAVIQEAGQHLLDCHAQPFAESQSDVQLNRYASSKILALSKYLGLLHFPQSRVCIVFGYDQHCSPGTLLFWISIGVFWVLMQIENIPAGNMSRSRGILFSSNNWKWKSPTKDNEGFKISFIVHQPSPSWKFEKIVWLLWHITLTELCRQSRSPLILTLTMASSFGK